MTCTFCDNAVRSEGKRVRIHTSTYTATKERIEREKDISDRIMAVWPFQLLACKNRIVLLLLLLLLPASEDDVNIITVTSDLSRQQDAATSCLCSKHFCLYVNQGNFGVYYHV